MSLMCVELYRYENAKRIQRNLYLSLNQDLSMITSNELNVHVYTNENYFEESRYIQPEMWYYDTRDSAGNLLVNANLSNCGVFEADQYQILRHIDWRRQFGADITFLFLVHYEMSIRTIKRCLQIVC